MSASGGSDGESVAASVKEFPRTGGGRDSPALSLVVTTYTEDRLKDVAALLASVRRQTVHNLEVIFVGEGTAALCAEAERLARAIGVSRFRAILNTGPPGLSGARNAALPLIEGEIVAFVDDDVVLSPDWAEKLVDVFARDHSVVGIAGAAVPLWEDPQMGWLPEEFYWLISCTAWFDGRRGMSMRNAWGVNMAFRRDAIAHAQFDERLGGNVGATDGRKRGLLGEDTVFSLRVRESTHGGRIVYDPDIQVLHKIYRYRLTPRYVRRRAFWEGYTKAVLRRETGLAIAGAAGPEGRLLRRILLRLLPRTAGLLVRNPLLASRRLGFTMSTIFFVALGHASGRFGPLGRYVVPRFE